jgi:hypothetical protein
LNAQEVGSALYGLQHMSDSHTEVRQLLAALGPKVQQCRNLDGQGVGNALFGLQCMEDSHEVQVLIEALGSKMQQCSEDMLLKEVKKCKKVLRALPRFNEPRHSSLFIAEVFRSLMHPSLEDLSKNIDNEFGKHS